MPFTVPMALREPTNHFDDWYFWLTKFEGYFKKENGRIKDPNMPSSIRLVSRNADLAVSVVPLDWLDIVLENNGDNMMMTLLLPTGLSSDEQHLIKWFARWFEFGEGFK